ncbi:MAG: hypothetical protein AUJ01_04430 [Acidobacteria bacterium 13_1_40CM_3_65_5]|nr:MAG: hypothetical protein AUJ01_04430 [Acidobacteria bacterium 13_1_40CM_3_65_5]
MISRSVAVALAIDGRLGDRQRQHADDDQDEGDEQPELVGDDDAEARRAVFPEQHRRDGGAGEADGAKRTDRHPLAGRAERLGDHGGDGRRGHAGHGHDRVE